VHQDELRSVCDHLGAATGAAKPAGVYTAAAGACVADYEDTPGDVDCGQLPSAMKSITVHNPSNDPYGLDGDKDGRACER
jgi:hypothetical protein